jgi:hypothetical protein
MSGLCGLGPRHLRTGVHSKPLLSHGQFVCRWHIQTDKNKENIEINIPYTDNGIIFIRPQKILILWNLNLGFGPIYNHVLMITKSFTNFIKVTF